jgi:surfeit locus 1 family protein
MLLSPRVREGVHGAHVVTPLIRENGSTILVDRGFVSREFASSIDSNPYEGEVEVLGMLRTSQPRNRFTPDNKPSEGLWYWNDVEKMADSAGGEQANVQPVFVEQIFGKSPPLSTFACSHSQLRGPRWRGRN